MTEREVVFEWASGGSAKLVETDGETLLLLSTTAAAPGAPLVGAFDGQSFRIKVRSCRRTDDDAERPYRIEGRFQNLSRALRERLLPT